MNIVVFGSTGSIGSALIEELSAKFPDATIHAVSRQASQFDSKNILPYALDFTDEDKLKALGKTISEFGRLDLIFIATGILHQDNIRPEKALSQISSEKLFTLFKANTIVPTLICKYFLPLLNKESLSITAILSARIGSISDNRLGGWYSYRASKAALNMIIKTASIELKRTNNNAIIVGLHPGTVDSHLSKPFQTNVPEGKLFTPKFCSKKLLEVIDFVDINDSGKCFAWDKSEIDP